MKQTTRNRKALLMLCIIMPALSAARAEEPSRIIEIHAHRFSFVPSEITLKSGETVTLRLISDDVAHNLLIPGLKVNQEVTKGHPVDVTVTPGSLGDYRGKCGRFCGSGHGSMLFLVHVKE